MFFMPPMSLGLTRYSRAGGSFSPASLFANGEQGGWYDPSDLSTLFQSSVGGVPALPGDPVGLVLDKSGNGINLSQPTAAARPTLGRVPVTGRRNLLIATDTFTVGWSQTNVTTTLNGTELTVISNAVSGNHRVLQSLILSGSVSGTIEAKAAGYNWLKLRVGLFAYANLNLQTGELGASEGVVVSVPFLTDDGFWRVSVSTSNGISSLIAHGMPTDTIGNDASYLGDGVSGIIIRNPQLEIDGPSPYQKVTNAFDVTEAGVPDCYYLRPDLTDDALTTVLPQAINGDILIAGRNGTIIEPVSYAASSTFALGPDTYTDGASGVLAAVGDIVAVLLIDKTLTQLERDNLVAYYQAKGAGGLL